MIFIEVKSMAGSNYIRAAQVLAVQFTDPSRCTILLQGGVSLQCAEPAKLIVDKLENALSGEPAAASTPN